MSSIVIWTMLDPSLESSFVMIFSQSYFVSYERFFSGDWLWWEIDFSHIICGMKYYLYQFSIKVALHLVLRHQGSDYLINKFNHLDGDTWLLGMHKFVTFSEADVLHSNFSLNCIQIENFLSWFFCSKVKVDYSK